MYVVRVMAYKTLPLISKRHTGKTQALEVIGEGSDICKLGANLHPLSERG
jgi:hypothetical protein